MIQNLLQVSTTDLSPLLSTLGIPIVEGGVSGIAGYALGKVLKTLVKILAYAVLAVIGVEIVVAGILESLGAVNITITINYDKLTEISTTATNWITSQFGALTTMLSSLTVVGVGFGGGLLLGFTH
jgi:uncharacterized membrane protein (Fun14 family)